ncbi:MAG: glycoside hydrolase family 38 C-terminal domain-containing protein [Phycisphaerae bacterium]
MSQPRIEQLKQDMLFLSFDRQHVTDRFLAEVEFARGLIKLHPQKAAAWNKLIDHAVKTVRDGLTAGTCDQALARAEKILDPIGKVAKTYTIHCVGHAHIDMNWMWSWPETVAVTNDTFITVLKLMDEFPGFCFSQSQASVYALMRDFHPEIFEQIKKRIAQGRWEVVASHWVEGDKNLASGESLTRHLLYTRRFMEKNFNLKPEDVAIDWSPDTFGHAWTIPSIDSRGGVKYYYLCRGGRSPKPPVFWWRGPDGSRILVNLETTWYLNQMGSHNTTALLAFCEKTGIRDWMNVYGVGDHGGGPTRRDILRALDMNSWPIYPNFVFTTTKKYYALLEKNADKWPTWDADLNFEFTGCYTTQTLIKKSNRLAENYLVETEAIATLAHYLLGRPYPTEKIHQAWTDTLFTHFHDILPGSGVRATRDYNQGTFQKIAATTGMIKTNALRALAARIDTSFAGTVEIPSLPPERETIALGAGVGRGSMLGDISSAVHAGDGPRAFVVFNPTAQDRGEVVTVSVWDSDIGVNPGDLRKKSFVVRAPDGKTVSAQKIKTGDYWGHKFIDLAFPVSVGSLSYSPRLLEEGQADKDDRDGVICDDKLEWEKIIITSHAMENEYLAVDFDRVTGGITKLIDKTTGKNLACPEKPLGLLEYLLERPGPMSSWVIHTPQQRLYPIEVESFEKGLRGPHVADVTAKMKIKDSTATVTYTLKAGQPWLEIAVAAVWVERGGPQIGTPTLRIRFPFALTDAKAQYEIPFGSIRRDLNHGEEVPALRWADVTGKVPGASAPVGCALLNDSKHGHSLDGSALGLTLIRSSYEPDILPEIGEHTVRLALVPHGKALSVAQLTRLGEAFNHPLQIVSTDVHKGTLPSQVSALAVSDTENVLITTLKKAEDQDAIILRLLETLGRPTTARIKIHRLLGTPIEAVEVDFLERAVEKSSARIVKDGLTVKLPAHGIAGVKITFAPQT